ncbi:hypothetical protein CWE09_12525 [Aliidiomarina minuta]|uniref:Peptidase n=1 Tax=Aliidiomarina minuta TaxID=880057 RepID=A0A432W3Q7_9GAMM|nr:PepSY-associated TM helix domain-containing protein [Aliidiomarina minuta]RUO23968.1 hypothetical protein CWE09_12525 [Aliidiomarina minuta]
MVRNYLGSVRQWHWISSALCLAALLLFAITGFTLNHAASIEATPKVTEHIVEMPQALLEQLQQSEPEVPANVDQWIRDELNVSIAGSGAEWSPHDFYLSMPRPGGDAWLSIDFANGEVLYEVTSRGWISYFNDLHKGRHTGAAWSLFIDLTALACVIFAITGLVLLQRHSSKRPSTWPLTSLGLLAPILLLLLFSHNG